MAFPRPYSLLATLICFLMFNIGSVFSTPVDFNFEGALSSKDELLIVSLGTGCDTGLTLRDCGLRNAAFPFDWLVTDNHECFIKILDEDFEFFTDEKYIEPLIDPRLWEHPNCLKNTYYDILMYHEGMTLYEWSDLDKYQEQLGRVKEKYARRTDRFREIRFFEGKVFFIRNFASPTQEQANRHSIMAEELKEALCRYFPEVDFTLVIVTYNDVNAPPIHNIDEVIEFRLDRNQWQNEYAQMYQVLLSR